MTDTIAAIATPLGEAGIGIIRLSGPEALAIARRLFQPARPLPPGPWPSHRLILGRIKDPATGQVIDEVLLCYMRGPRSYTREDVVEIQCHSGYAVLRHLLELVLQEGARLASPGEFTLRAFLAGRIDLTQAEAVLELIQARSEAGLKVAADHLTGSLGRELSQWREEVLDLLAQVEADLDFGEELPPLDAAALVEPLDNLISRIETLCRSYSQGRLFQEGLQVVLAGRPNVGKSSLLNRLLETERAIVTDIPGTTRDILRESLIIEGLPVVLHDTAGLRPPQDQVEEIGIQRTREQLARADLILYLIDASQPLASEDLEQLRELTLPALVVLNKIDLPPRVTAAELQTQVSFPILELSARTGAGLPELRKAIAAQALKGVSPASGQIVTQARHRQHLERCHSHLRAARELLGGGQPLELVALELQTAAQELGQILGLEIGEEVLDRIFSRFCLGK